MKNTKKIQFNREIESYISRVRKDGIRHRLKRAFTKKRKKDIDERIPVDKVQRSMDKGPISDRDFGIEEGIGLAQNPPLIGCWCSKIAGLFRKPSEAYASEEGVGEMEETELNNDEFERELREIEKVEQKKDSKRGVLGLIPGFGLLNKARSEQRYGSPSEEDVEEADSGKITRVVLERPEVEKDIKRLALVTQSILQELPDEKIHSFKKSDEFLVYKDVLKKYNLIKEGDKNG